MRPGGRARKNRIRLATFSSVAPAGGKVRSGYRNRKRRGHNRGAHRPAPPGGSRMTSPEYDVPASVRVPPAPGEESAGPALTDIVRETRRSAAVLAAPYRQPPYEASQPA